MGWISNWLHTRSGAIGGGVLLMGLLALAVLVGMRTFGGSEAGNASRRRPFVCAETGKGFYADIDVGTPIPVMSPYSHKNTGYPAELCYWTADGKVKKEPTLVLINEWLGKNEPTFCPDCGRLVVGRNPGPEPGHRPPPTRQEYDARRNVRQ